MRSRPNVAPWRGRRARAASGRARAHRGGPRGRRRRRRGRRSPIRTAISAAARAAPSVAASTTMRASRGGSGRRRSFRPSSVMRPSPSMAPSSTSNAFASASAGRGGGSRKRELLGDGAPGGKVEREGRQIGREDFRPRISLECGGLRLVPQPVADAGLGPPGAAAALIGGGARHAHGFEPRDADVGLVARHARKPTVDHDAHALDGDRRLGDRRRKHDLPPAGRGGGDGAVLLLAGECAVERDHVDGRIEPAGEQRRGAADFGGTGKKRQQRTGIARAWPAQWRQRFAARSAGHRGRDSGSQPGRRGLRRRRAALPRAVSPPARRRGSPT